MDNQIVHPKCSPHPHKALLEPSRYQGAISAHHLPCSGEEGRRSRNGPCFPPEIDSRWSPQRPAELSPQLLLRPHLLRCRSPPGPRLPRAQLATCFFRHTGQSVRGFPELRPAGVGVQGQEQRQQAQSCRNTKSQVRTRQHPGSPCVCRRPAPRSDVQPHRGGDQGWWWGPSLWAASQRLGAAAAGPVSRQT